MFRRERFLRWMGLGHTFGVRVDGTSPRGLWPPDGGRLCRRVVKGKVLRIDRPDGRRVLKFDGAFGPEGCGLPLRGNTYEVSVTGLAVCVICDTISSATYFLVSP